MAHTKTVQNLPEKNRCIKNQAGHGRILILEDIFLLFDLKSLVYLNAH
jgi:uncharacterized membrane protein